MKTYIIATLIFAPSLLILNESANLWPNLSGVAYIVALMALSRTPRGRRIVKTLYKKGAALLGPMK